MCRRASTVTAVSVRTSSPSATGSTQAGWSPARPVISTTQSRQEPSGGSAGWWQRVGITTPAFCAASSTEAPAGTSTVRPSIVRVTAVFSEASAMLNAIYNGGEVDAERMQRIIGLYRMDFKNPSDMHAELAGKPVFLGLAVTPDHLLRMKPQNLLVNLPLARRA